MNNTKNILLAIVATTSYVLMIGKPFKSYLGKDTVYNFINSITEERR